VFGIRNTIATRGREIDPRLRQVAVFGLIGVVATATHAAAALLAHEQLGLHPFVANFVGYCCAFSVSYFGNARFTFARRALHGPQFLRFLGVSLMGLALSQALTYLCTELLHLPFAVALIPVVTLVPILSFILSRVYAFADPAK
jgi:putative flippase GtrA